MMLGCRDIGIRISEFHAKTEFIQNSDFFDPFDSGNIVCSLFRSGYK